MESTVDDFICKEPWFIEAKLDSLFRGVLKMNDPRRILTCLELFEDELFGNINAIFIDNEHGKNYMLTLHHKIEHCYMGFELNGTISSIGRLFPNETKGLSLKMISDRYIVIFRSFGYIDHWAVNWNGLWACNFLKPINVKWGRPNFKV